MDTRPVVWVIGATGAIGEAVVRRVREAGTRVVRSSRGVADADGEAFALDVADPQAVADGVARIVAEFGRLDGLVISVAAKAFGNFLDLADVDWRRAIETKLLGSMSVIRAVAPHMLAAGSGRIVLITGRGTRPPPQHLPGAGINAALNLIIQGLGGEWAASGVNINAVAPGPVASSRLDALRAAGGQAQGGAALLPEDVADAVAFLLSPAARAIAGTVLTVDAGGLRSGKPDG